MPIWLILAVFAAIGVTALLTAVLYRINQTNDGVAPSGRTAKRDAIDHPGD